jgi:hypothetical protein
MMAACSASPVNPNIAPASQVLSGTMSVFSEKGDDYGYRIVLTLSDVGGFSATATKALVTVSAPTGAIVKPFASVVLSSLDPGKHMDHVLEIPNEPGLGLATTATLEITYVDASGRAGALSFTQPVPTCFTYYGAVCHPAQLDVGQTASCSGDMEFGCYPMHYVLAGDQYKWQSQSPETVTVGTDGTLKALSNGSSGSLSRRKP